MKKKYTVLLILFVVLGIFYPTAFGELCSVDDQKLVTTLTNQDSLHLKKLFLRRGSYYYRPLTSLSFQLDKKLFLCQPQIMHMENILIHLANVLMLFFIISRFLVYQKKSLTNMTFYFPAIIALFFGIHPLTTEAVNWISDRTDLLAGFFCLASFALFSLSKNKSTWLTDSISALLFFFALLAKEVAISLFILIVFATIWEGFPTYTRDLSHRIKRIIPFIVVTIVYVWMRTGFRLAQDSGVRSAIHGAHDATRIPYMVKLCSLIKALGFYCKKIIWPFPLNFAIVDINRPLCFIIGIITCLSIIYLLWKRKGLISFFLLWLVLFIAPALLVAINKMAWTPLAERYLYIPLMGLTISIGLIISQFYSETLMIAFIMLLFTFGIVTTKRNITWQKNVTLFADVVAKSPNFPPGYNEYASALLYEGKVKEAKEQFQIAAQLCRKGSAKTIAATNLAGVEKKKNITCLFRDILANVKESKIKRRLLHKLSKDINQQILETTDTKERKRLLHQNILILEELRKLDKNPFFLYRLGQLYLAQGDKQRARIYFGLACRNSHDYYTEPACQLHRQLSKDLSKSE